MTTEPTTRVLPKRNCRLCGAVCTTIDRRGGFCNSCLWWTVPTLEERMAEEIKALREQLAEAQEHTSRLVDEMSWCRACRPIGDEGVHFRHDGGPCSYHPGECSEVPHTHQFCSCGSNEQVEKQLVEAQAALRRLIEAVDSGALVFSHDSTQCGYRSYTDLEGAANHARALLKEKA